MEEGGTGRTEDEGEDDDYTKAGGFKAMHAVFSPSQTSVITQPNKIPNGVINDNAITKPATPLPLILLFIKHLDSTVVTSIPSAKAYATRFASASSRNATIHLPSPSRSISSPNRQDHSQLSRTYPHREKAPINLDTPSESSQSPQTQYQQEQSMRRIRKQYYLALSPPKTSSEPKNGHNPPVRGSLFPPPPTATPAPTDYATATPAEPTIPPKPTQRPSFSSLHNPPPPPNYSDKLFEQFLVVGLAPTPVGPDAAKGFTYYHKGTSPNPASPVKRRVELLYHFPPDKEYLFP